MSESSKRAIFAVIRTLNQITVAGRDNLDMLLASIMALEKLLNEPEDGGKENG